MATRCLSIYVFEHKPTSVSDKSNISVSKHIISETNSNVC